MTEGCTYQCFGSRLDCFTHMKMDSLMVLACPWSSLPMILKLVPVMLCPVCCMCAWMGEGCLRCSLHLSPNVLAVSSYVLLIAGYVVALETVDNPTLLFFRVLVFWLHEDLFYLYVVLKCSCIPYLPHVCLKLSARPFVYGMTTYATVDLGP